MDNELVNNFLKSIEETSGVKSCKTGMLHVFNSPIVMPSGPTLYVDCDDTLIEWTMPSEDQKETVQITCEGITDTYRYNSNNIEYLKQMARRGHRVVVWTQAGASWADAIVKALNLQQYVFACLTKPCYYMDDIKDPKRWCGKYRYSDFEGNVVRDEV